MFRVAPYKQAVGYDKTVGLYYWNICLSVLHYASFITAISLYFSVESINNFYVNTLNSQLTYNNGYVKIDTYKTGGYPLGVLAAMPNLTTGFAHMMYAIYYDSYYKSVAEGKFYLRWVEYLSSSITMVCISNLFGIVDVYATVFVAISNACVMYTGYVYDRTREASDWFAGFGIGMSTWICVFSSFSSTSSGAPWWVWFITFGYFLCYWSFGVLGWYGPKATPDKRVRNEVYWMLLSLTAKMLLVWTVFGAAMGPNPFGEQVATYVAPPMPASDGYAPTVISKTRTPTLTPSPTRTL